MQRRVTACVVWASRRHTALPWPMRAGAASRGDEQRGAQLRPCAVTLTACCTVRRTFTPSSSAPPPSPHGAGATSSLTDRDTAARVGGFGAGVAARVGASSPLPDTPPPPHPAHYVPPAERPITDASLDFLPAGGDLARRHVSVEAGRFLAALERAASYDAPADDGGQAVTMDGPQIRSPHLRARCAPTPMYLDEDAARVRSTSLYAGQSLLRTRSNGADGGDFVPAARRRDAEGDDAREGAAGEEDVLRAVPHPTRQDMRAATSDAATGADGPTSTPFRQRSNLRTPSPPLSSSSSSFSASSSFSQSSFTPSGPHTNVDELTLDMKKLEYYHGTPRYEELLHEFQIKYDLLPPQPRLASEAASGADKLSGSEAARAGVATLERAAADVEPVDFAHLSSAAKLRMMNGPAGYHPQTLLAMYGKDKFHGYAFPATLELGQLDQLALAAAARHRPTLWQTVRHRVAALLGRPHAYSAEESHLVADAEAAKEDTHILYRVFGLDAVQRRQMRYVLSDFDCADRGTALHVLLSYPYADWLHTFLVVCVGWLLYKLQVYFNAYDFYDEYMGLDLRQTPELKTPFLIIIATVVVGCVLFQPILLTSIATNRWYRIAMRRPVGPP